jgi:hypothetical protein
MPTHPDDPNATYLGTFTVNVQITAAAKTATVTNDIIVMETSGGRVDYILSAAGVTFTGDPEPIDGSTTVEIFDALSLEAMNQGISQSYSSCPGSCVTPGRSRVYVEACVTRGGSGTSTQFTLCSSTPFGYREYNYCCPSSPPTISSGTNSAPSCTSPCESTIQ